MNSTCHHRFLFFLLSTGESMTVRLDREHSSSPLCSADFLVCLFNVGPFFNDDDCHGHYRTGAKDNKSLVVRLSALGVGIQDEASIRVNVKRGGICCGSSGDETFKIRTRSSRATGCATEPRFGTDRLAHDTATANRAPKRLSRGHIFFGFQLK